MAIPFKACGQFGQFGPVFHPPTQHDLQGKLLEEDHAKTKSLLKDREDEKNKHGCSIILMLGHI